MRPLPPQTVEQCGVFSIHQARAAGWTPAALRHAIRADRIRRLRVGAYEAVDLDDVADGLSGFDKARWRHAAPAIGAALLVPGVAASHSTSAVLHGLSLLFLPSRGCVCVPPWLTGEVHGVHLHRCSVRDRSVLTDFEVIDVEQTVIDLAREHGRLAGLVAADSALYLGRTSVPRLEEAVSRCVRWPGVRAAREAIAFANAHSESVLETRSRLALSDWGIQAPELQVRIGTAEGRFVARVDFYWGEYGVIGEADGAMKYDGTDPAALLAEKRRQSALEDLDLAVVRWGAADLRDFGAVAARLRRTFVRQGRRDHTRRPWVVLPPTSTR